MKKKQILILCFILVLLGAGILLKSWIRSTEDNAEDLSRSVVSIASLDPLKVERILIGRPLTQALLPASQTASVIPTPPVELIKEKNVWRVKSLWNVKADPQKIEALLSQLRSLQGELRGNDKKLFVDFGIEEGEAFSVKCYGVGGAVLLDLRLGLKQAGPQSYFVREASGKDVFLVDLDKEKLLGLSEGFDEGAPLSSAWADLGLFDLKADKVTKITITQFQGDKRNQLLGLVRDPQSQDPLANDWKFLRKEMTLGVDPEKVLKFIATLTSIKAQKVMDPTKKDYGLESPAWQLAITEGDKKILLNASAKSPKEEPFFVKLSSDPTVFSLSSGYFEDLNTDDTRFVKEVLPTPEAVKTATAKAGGQVS